MREILFRGKTDKGEWVQGFYFEYGYDCTNHFCIGTSPLSANDYSEIHSSTYAEVIPETVGQYTGLTDKNGKKIFEGDILSPFPDETVVVEWIDFYSTLGLKVYREVEEIKRKKKIKTVYCGWAMLTDYELEYSEVIGNIHDNPKPLKGE